MDAVETKNLLLRPLTRADSHAMASILGNDPDMTWDHSSRTEAQVAATVLDRISHYHAHGFGVLAVIDKANQALIGQCGLQRLLGRLEVELVSYTARIRWRQGVALEACSAMLYYAFNILLLSEVVAVTRRDDKKGRALSERLGFRSAREDVLYNTNVLVSSLRADEFMPPAIPRVFTVPDDPRLF